MNKNIFVLEYPYDIDLKIENIDNKEVKMIEKSMDLSIFKKFSKNKKKINIIKNKNKESFLSLIEQKVYETSRINNLHLYELFFYGKKIETSFLPICLDYKNEECIKVFDEGLKLEKNQNNLKFNIIRSTMLNKDVYKELHKYDYCERTNILYNIKLALLIRLYKNLKIGGTFITEILDYCSLKSINLIYLTLFLFEKVVILNGNLIIGIGFTGIKNISKDYLESLFDKEIKIEPMYKKDSLINYLKNSFKFKNELLEDLFKKKYKKYIYKSFENDINSMIEKDINYKYIYDLMNNFFNVFGINENNDWLFKKIENKQKDICFQLNKLIHLTSSDKFLEIGIGLGVISDCILSNKSGDKNKILFAIDDDQEKIWNNYAINKIKKKKLSKYFKYYNEESIEALQNIKNEYGDFYFDMIIINKCESFDKLLLQVYYSKKLLKMHGFLIFNNINSIGFYKLVDFINLNYKDLDLVNNIYECLVYKKIEQNILSCEQFTLF